MIERVHIIITLIAALFVTVACFITEVSLTEFAIKLSLTITVFFIIGYFIKGYFKRKIFISTNDYELEDDVPPSEMVEPEIPESELADIEQ